MRNNKMEVDIHNMTSKEAKYKLERILASIPPNITEIKVIHGYHGGQTLKNMVKNELKSKKIKHKFSTLNQGETILILV